MTERDDRSDIADRPEWCVLSDLADTFRLGGRKSPMGNGELSPVLLRSTFLLLGWKCADLVSVEVLSREDVGLGVVMNP